MDPDCGPQQVQNKVQFDIWFYLCRRDWENFQAMDKETFALQYDVDTKIAYVKKVKDEMTKNHKTKDNEITTGFMPQVLTPSGQPHKLCPVCSYENYINKLNPECNSLWQQPLKRIKDPTSGAQSSWQVFRKLVHGMQPLPVLHQSLYQGDRHHQF